MKQIFLVSSFFELVCLTAGIDSGAYDTPAAPALLGTDGKTLDGGGRADERILLISNNAMVLELAVPILDTAGADSLLTRFDRVIDLNAAIHPAHPSSWSPSDADLPMIESLLRDEWGLSLAPLELILESPQVNPAIALGRIFGRATIRVHADGLMSYGPTRSAIPLSNGQRVSTLHFLPLVPGLEPRLLAEFGIVAAPLDLDAFRAIVSEAAEASADIVARDLPAIASATESSWALALGQYLAALGLITEEEETALHIDMIRRASDRGFTTIVFKPHPAAPPARLAPLRIAAEHAGVRLTILESPLLAEVLFDRCRPGLVLGGFSTALATARTVYGIPVVPVGTQRLLGAISPYQNSNRIPLTIISEFGRSTGAPTTGALPNGPASAGAPLAEPSPVDAALIRAVTYCMASELSRDLRAGTIRTLESLDDATRQRYFTSKRLAALGLPGATPTEFAARHFARRSLRTARRTAALAGQAINRKRHRLTKPTN